MTRARLCCKPEDQVRIGTEHEKFPFYRADLRPVPYAGRPERGEAGIAALITGLHDRTGWEEITDSGAVIGLFDPQVAQGEGGAVSLEPGGQFELSGAPLQTLHETATELAAHLALANDVARPHGIGFFGLGMSPTWTLAETPVMPKSRYKIMMNYMPRVGSRGLDMMFRTATVQVNLDFCSEADMVQKLRVSLALQPVATALFANSPFTEGRPNGFLSARSEIWRDTDNERAGMLPFVFEEGMGFERYVDYALEVPMYFVKRGAIYHDVAGSDFRDLLAGRLPQLPGEWATMSDWANHLSTIFPEVRLKRYLEMRGADGGSAAHMTALSAFFVGLLYDKTSLDAAYDLIRPWTREQRQELRDSVPKRALDASIGGQRLRDVAREALAIARAGLTARKKLDPGGRDETCYLDVLEERIKSGRVAAQALLAQFEGAWHGDITKVFDECAL
jgi:glutamate--cysteine ligase